MAKKLTGKQLAFVEHYCGKAMFNATQAAKMAGYKGAYQTLASMGEQNLKKPEIRQAIRDFLESRSITAEIVLDSFRTIALDPDEKTSDRLRALENLGKALNIYEDHEGAGSPQGFVIDLRRKA